MRDATRALEALRALPCGARLLDAAAGRRDVWLVGGAVRDVLLGRPPRELDLVVVGDPGPLAAVLGEVVERHERFATLTVRDGDCRFDVARARTETYAHPGALPDVQPAGSIREDLRRRDVTVNALALSPSGEIVAVADAFEDLAGRRLRVLHERSFLDDPTRLWRVARYRARLGFEVEEHTRKLARDAVAAGALGTVSGERIGNELRLALGEPDPCAAIEAAVELGLLDVEVDRERVGAALERLGDAGRADLCVAAALGLDLSGLGFTRAEERVLERARALVPATAGGARSATAAAYASEPAEAVAVAGGAEADWWLREGRHVTLEITGADLLAAGVPRGPAVGEGLRRALAAQLDGRAASRDEELAAALGGKNQPG